MPGIQAPPPPYLPLSPGQLAGSCLMVLNSQSFLPVAASTPKILPCAANSPAVEPKVSTSPATTGGEVKLQPWQLASA